MLKRTLSIVCCALFLLALSACDTTGDDEPDVSANAFEVEVEGDVDASISGIAFFGTGEDTDAGEDIFGIVLSSSEEIELGTTAWGSITRSADRPSTGTYAFANLDAEGSGDYPPEQFGLFLSLPDEQAFFASNSGELIITESSDDEVAGTFVIEATGFRLTQGGTQEALDVTVTGEFNAGHPDDFVLPDSF